MASDGGRRNGLSIGSLVRFSADKYPAFPYSGCVGEVTRVVARGSGFFVKFDGCDRQFLASAEEVDPVMEID